MIVKVDRLWQDCSVQGYGTFRIHDSSLGRLGQHLGNGIVIISAMRGGFPIGKTYEQFTADEREKYKENLRRTEELKKDIRALGYGYIPTIGGYPESVENEDRKINVNEFSFAVPYKQGVLDEQEFVDTMVDLALKYEQDSILVSGFDWYENGQARLLLTKEREPLKEKLEKGVDVGNLHYHEETDVEERPYYTRLKKGNERNFVFDAKSKKLLSKYIGTHRPVGMFGNMVADKSGEIY